MYELVFLVIMIMLVKQVEEEVRESKEALKKVQSRLLQLGSSLTLQQATEQLNKVFLGLLVAVTWKKYKLTQVTEETSVLKERLSKLEGNTQVFSIPYLMAGSNSRIEF